MTKPITVVHHPDRRTDVDIPYAPGVVIRHGQLVFLSGVAPAPIYHSRPHRDEAFNLEAAGCTLNDVLAVTRYLTAVVEQDDLGVTQSA